MAVTAIRPNAAPGITISLDEGVNLDGENRKAKQIAGVCARRGCQRPSLDDSDYCGPHRKDQRRYHREYMQRQREAWDAEDACTNCGAEDRAPGSKWCTGCLVRREKTGVKVDGEIKRQRIAANTTERTTVSNLGRTHYHGRGKVGRSSTAEQDRQDFDDGIKLAARSQAGMEYAATPEVQALPRYQRDEAKNAALSLATRALRHIAAVLHRHKVDVVQLVASVDEDGD